MREPRHAVRQRGIAATAAVVAILLIGAVGLKIYAAGYFGAGASENGILSAHGASIGDVSPAAGDVPPSPGPVTSSPATKAPKPSASASSSAKKHTSSQPKALAAGAKPVASNTGVPRGTALKVVSGNQTYGSSSNGKTISGKDFHGYVRVTGANITFRNSIFRGGQPSGNNALLDTNDSTGHVTVLDSEFAPTNPAATIDGLWLTNATVARINVHGTVDGIKADSGSVISDSYIHDMQWFADDPNQGGGETHNDAIQILSGNGITIDGDNLDPAGKDANSAIQITQDGGPTSHVTITDNWADYGGCTFNFAHKGGGSMSIGPVTGNRFGRHEGFGDCPILLSTQTSLVTDSGNVWSDTGGPIPKPQQHD